MSFDYEYCNPNKPGVCVLCCRLCDYENLVSIRTNRINFIVKQNLYTLG